jgi:diguanylate cyclase (GGDEF)-like protein/PAS domain S-box-containing protein
MRSGAGDDLEVRVNALVSELNSISAQLLAEIAERKQAEETLRDREETIRALLNAPTDTALLIDADGKILALNDTAQTRLSSYLNGDHPQRRSLVGSCVYDLFPGIVTRRRKARNDRVLRSGKPARFVDEKDGRWFDHSIYPVHGAHDEVSGLAIFSRDITDAKRAEEALRQSQETVRALLNAPTDAALLIDAGGEILALNETAAQRLATHARVSIRRSHDALLGRNVYDLLPGELAAPRRERNEQVVATGKPARYEDERNGSWFDNSIYPVFGADGRVAGLAIFSRDITELKRAQEHFRHMAYHDSLTGLPNRAAFRARFDVALAKARRSGRGLAVMCLDLDRFKHINDTLGHAAGDQLLQAVGERLAGLVREGDTAARLGGDEFTLILPGISRPEDAVYVANRFIEAMRAPFEGIEGRTIATTTSVGICLFDPARDDGETLLKNADTALYRAKQRGRNTYEIFPDPVVTAAAAASQ